MYGRSKGIAIEVIVIGIIVIAIAGLGIYLATSRGVQQPGEGQRQLPNLQVTSSAFLNRNPIPREYTADGNDISPPLSIRGIPGNSKSLAIIMEDPDAPGGVFTHWLIWNIPTSTSSIPENVPAQSQVGDLGGALQGRNDFGEMGYSGPSPPSGSTHTYKFKVYALDKALGLQSGASKAELESAIQNHILAKGELTGTYSR